MDKYKLTIVTKDRIIYIPFKDIRELDEFTVLYDSYVSLANSLNSMLNLNIEDTYRLEIFITYTYKKNNSDTFETCYLPVKYSYHNFLISDLIKVYSDYYKDDHAKIVSTSEGIRNVNNVHINEYVKAREKNENSRDVTNNDIDIAVSAYFRDAGYKKYRDAYFRVYEAGYDVKNKTVKDQLTSGEEALALKALTGYNIETLSEYADAGKITKGHKR